MDTDMDTSVEVKKAVASSGVIPERFSHVAPTTFVEATSYYLAKDMQCGPELFKDAVDMLVEAEVLVEDDKLPAFVCPDKSKQEELHYENLSRPIEIRPSEVIAALILRRTFDEVALAAKPLDIHIEDTSEVSYLKPDAYQFDLAYSYYCGAVSLYRVTNGCMTEKCSFGDVAASWFAIAAEFSQGSRDLRQYLKEAKEAAGMDQE